MTTDLAGLELKELETFVQSLGHKKFHAKQIYQWIWKRGVTDFASMTNLSRELRTALEEKASISLPEVEQHAAEPEHRVRRHRDEEQALARDDERTRQVLEHLSVAAQTADRCDDEVVRDHVDGHEDEEREAAEGRPAPDARATVRDLRAHP